MNTKILMCMLFIFVLTACSTAGGLYKENDTEHGEFSLQKTILTVIGTIGAAAIIKSNPNTNDDYSNMYWYDLLE